MYSGGWLSDDRVTNQPFPQALPASSGWSWFLLIFRVGQCPMVKWRTLEIWWAKPGPALGQIWAKKQNAHLKWAFVQAKCLILLVAREGFEPPTWVMSLSLLLCIHSDFLFS
jgi:hypothetical protein